MPKSLNLISQIKELCLITKADWVVIIVRKKEIWEIQIVQGLNKQGQSILRNYLNDPVINAWVSGALLSGRGRWRKFSEKAFHLDCERLYLFPSQSIDIALIVGTDELDKTGQTFWRIFAGMINGSQLITPPFSTDLQITPQKEKFSAIQYQGLSGLLDRIIEQVQQIVQYEALWIGIKHGEVLVIEKATNGADWLEQTEFQTEDATNIFSLLDNGITHRELNSPGWSFLHQSINGTSSRFWVGIPILNGQTIIGLISIFGSQRYLHKDLENIKQLAQHVASALYSEIERIEINSQLTFIHRFNDIVLAATQGENLEEVTRSIIRLMADNFKTPFVGLLLPTADQKYLYQYGTEPVDSESVYPLQDTLIGRVFETGIPIQIRDAGKEIVSFKLTPGILSELAVPLIYHGKVTGVLNVESTRANAFHRDMVELLDLVVGYIAGFLEFIRLQQETEVRSSN